MDTRTCYVTRHLCTAMESRYLKPTFKSGRTTLGIWGALTRGKKRAEYSLIKDGRMTSEEALIAERGDTIWMDDGAAYHTSKLTTKFLLRSGPINNA